MKNLQMSSNITKYLHMSLNVMMFFERLLVSFDDLILVIFDDLMPDLVGRILWSLVIFGDIFGHLLQEWKLCWIGGRRVLISNKFL